MSNAKTVWDTSNVRRLLLQNDKAVERAIVAIYEKQTEDEQRAGETKHHNNVGFNGSDARRGSYYARWIMSGRSLTGAHLERARKMCLKYAGQLVKIIAEKKGTPT